MKRFVWMAIMILLFLLIVMQLIPIKRLTSEISPAKDFLTICNAPADIKILIKNACYDCHSYETVLPWYAKVAPVSWMIKHHIAEGIDKLNFSDWTSYSPDDIKGLIKSCNVDIKDGDMPLLSYKLMHKEAHLNDKEINNILNFFNKMENISSQGKDSDE